MSAGEFTPADFARDVLSRFDRGEFSDPLAMTGHLASAVRMLLEATPEPGICGSCRKNPVKDRTSPAIGGQFCAGCLDRCADSGLADHVCAVDRWAEANERPGPDPGQLAAVRAVLDAFDWERDDRQYALEKIERIVTGGAR